MAIRLTSANSTADDSDAYACPMHPEVRARAPGQCPVCGMALQRRIHGGAPSGRDLRPLADVAAVENVRRHNVIDFVRKRSLLFNQRELRGPARVEGDGTVVVDLYRDQIDALAPGERGTFTLTESPDIAFPVHRTADPAVPRDQSTARLRFEPDAGTIGVTGHPSLQPGQAGWLALPPRPRQVLTVPASAVLQSPEGPYVLVSVGDLRFEKRPIAIGETFLKEGFAVVLSGLRVNERVVARATFFFDADRRQGGGEVAWVAP